MDGEGRMVLTDFGWALESPEPTSRHDLFWIPSGTNHVYSWDGDGWFRIRPPEKVPHTMKDLPHG